MRVLIDMDGTIADLEDSLRCNMDLMFPHIEMEINREEFEHPPHIDPYAKQIMAMKGFYANLPPIKGAIEAIKEMVDEGIEVVFCTSPLSDYTWCLAEKCEWIEKHFGREWVRRVVITKDKTIVSGDILIDDKPEITGMEKHPTWEHVLFDQSYNKWVVDDKRRLCEWTDWRKIIFNIN